MTNNYCTTRDAARLLGISVRTAQQWLEKGYLEGWKTDGGHRRITHVSVMRAIQDRRSAEKSGQRRYSLPVLIVEDDVALLKLYRLQLSMWPFDVTIYTAPNGYEGLVMVGESAPRLLICDLRLPGVSGFQIVRSLSNMERYADRMTIVVVSGLPVNEIDAHGGIPERVEVIGKPINFRRLQEIASKLWSCSNKEPTSDCGFHRPLRP
jgi:excisionase family DNA binding protein